MRGFTFENYVDVFDGGPTMTARTDQVHTVREARAAEIVAVDEDGGTPALVAAGTLAGFRCAYGRLRPCADGIALSKDAAACARRPPQETR